MTNVYVSIYIYISKQTNCYYYLALTSLLNVLVEGLMRKEI